MEPIPVTLSGETEERLSRELKPRLRALKQGLKPLFETNLPRWRRVYEALPAEKTRDFPFQNASNLVVPLAGIHCDTLKARVVSAIWKTRPIWLCNIVGSFDGAGDEPREAWQNFLLHNAFEPTELDLYQVELSWIGEIIRYGTSTIKIPYETIYEDYVLPAGDGSGRFEPMREKVYQGPRPKKLAFEDFLAEPSASCLEDSSLVAHRIRYQKHELLERRYSQFFRANRVDSILNSPDRTSPDYVQAQRESDANARTSSSDGYAEWDVYECWFSWRAPNSSKAPRIIVWYHYSTGTILNAIYDQYTPILKSLPFVVGRLLYRDDSLHGYGLCEILEMIQEEVSVMHNQRRDNVLVANTRVWRVDPDSKLHQGYQIYPSAMLPAVAGEIEPLQHGEVASITIDEERLSIDLAERRSGVSPPMQGMGAGTNTKRGVYSAMGTMSLMQEGNSRTDLTISDIRYGHTKIGRIISKLYAYMGLDESKLVQFGAMSEAIKAAAELIKKDKMALPVTASSASVNREVEKQSDLMLSQVLDRHYAKVTQLLQQVAMSALGPQIQQYSVKVIEASERFIKQVLKNFDHDDVDALVPKALAQQGPQPVPGRGGQGGAQGGPSAQNSPAIQPTQPGATMPVQPRVPADFELLAGMAGGGGKGA